MVDTRGTVLYICDTKILNGAHLKSKYETQDSLKYEPLLKIIKIVFQVQTLHSTPGQVLPGVHCLLVIKFSFHSTINY